MNTYRGRSTRVGVVVAVVCSSLLFLAVGIRALPETKSVKVRDDCEPTSFNAAVGPDTCVGNGKTTFAQFIEVLTRRQAHPAWRFNPRRFGLVEGKMVLLESRGGETHTFTKVEEFGGGFVPGLNALSGNPTPRPECALVLSDGSLAPQPESDANIFVEAGESEEGPTAGSSVLPTGQEIKFQCCIHPWMRVIVRVPER